MSKLVLGIDIAKLDLSVCLLIDSKPYFNSFLNESEGFKALLKWLKSFKLCNIEVYLEATGKYGNDVSNFLYSKGFTVKVVNPFQIKSFARTKLSRHKTDKIDASIIAEYGVKFESTSYHPLSVEQAELKELYRCSLAIKKQLIYCRNQLENESQLPKAVIKLWHSIERKYEAELKKIMVRITWIIKQNTETRESFELLQTIPGIGEVTAIACIAELPDLNNFTSARDLAAYIGLTPKHFESGTSIKRHSKISKMGNGIMRKALYLPAMSAMTSYPFFVAIRDKMSKLGKRPKVIICSIMRRLVHIIFGVLKNKTVFEQEKLQNNAFAT